jgi:ketosteroid isomerase-like protein
MHARFIPKEKSGSGTSLNLLRLDTGAATSPARQEKFVDGLTPKGVVVRCLICTLFLLSLASGVTDIEAAPQYAGKRVSTAADMAALKSVVGDFMTAIANKDSKRLAALVLNSYIPFFPAGDQTYVDRVRKSDPNFDGGGVGGFTDFAAYVNGTPDRIKETAYNAQITQDGDVAWVTFDYESYLNDQVTNYGVEQWALRKTDGKWRIFSVVWTVHKPGNP